MPAPTYATADSRAERVPEAPQGTASDTELRRFRVMAYVVGCWLLLLVGVAMPLEYVWHHPALARVVSPIHGVLYMVYMLATVLLGRRMAWSTRRMLGVMLAGTIPFVSFVIERKVVGWVRSAARDDRRGATESPKPVAAATGTRAAC